MLLKDQLSSRHMTTDTGSLTESPSLEPTYKLETVLRKALAHWSLHEILYTQPLHTHLLEIFLEMVAFKPRLHTSTRPAQAKAPSPSPTPLSSMQQGLRRIQDFVNNVSDRHYSLFLLLRVESSGCPQGRLPSQAAGFGSGNTKFWLHF